MSAIAAGIGISAAVGAAGTAIAGSEAAGATRDASREAISEQQAALQQQAQLSAPYRAFGESAIPQLQSLLGLTPGSDPTAALRQMPGYQFAQQEGTTNTLNAASAQGMNLSGNTLQSLSELNQGIADTTYQQSVGDLFNAVGIGQGAAAGQAANIGNAANNISSNLINQGNNLAGIDANTIAGLTKSLGNGINQYTTLNTLRGLYPGSGGYGGGGSGVPSYDYGPPSQGVTTTFDQPPGETSWLGG